MMADSRLSFVGIAILLFLAGLAEGHNHSAPAPTAPSGLNLHNPTGYKTNVYNVSAATTTISYSYSDEELAMLWDQVGKVATGKITTTVSPTPEPSSYARPGSYHGMVGYLNSMSARCLIWT